MAIANYNEEKPLIIYTFKKLCNGEQWLAAQQAFCVYAYIYISLVLHIVRERPLYCRVCTFIHMHDACL